MAENFTEKSRRAITGILVDENTVFERSSPGRTGYLFPPLEVPKRSPLKYCRSVPAALPETSEMDVVRHFTRLSSWNTSADHGIVPTGLGVMKYQPRVNEEVARIAGFSALHPELPLAFCQGALEVIYRLEQLLLAMTGLDDCTTQTTAGSNGKCAGLLIIRRFLEDHGSSRKLVLVPESELATHAADCRFVGYEAVPVKSSPRGILEPENIASVLDEHGREIAALLLTVPNYSGLFETEMAEITELIHGIGAQLFMDGSQMNSLLAVARPRDLGADLLHWNLHSAFATPCGSAGPDAGPILVRSHLAGYLPGPKIRKSGGKYFLEEQPNSVGRVREGFGNFGVLLRALAYILHQGSDGLKQISRAAVLNANYVRKRLSETIGLKGTDCSLQTFAIGTGEKSGGIELETLGRALLDQGVHPPTLHCPEQEPKKLSKALLIEPTETESIQELDRLIDALASVTRAIQNGEERFDNAPTKAIVGKMGALGPNDRPVLSLDDRR